jgi:2-polyprenyl-3-methyl-5-hydroxy-6-metoxy-1,4-benzoquinol methylase
MIPIRYDALDLIACPICQCNQFNPVTVRFDSGPIVKCVACKHIYLNPTLPSEVLDKIYSEEYFSEDETEVMDRVEYWFNDPLGPYSYALDLLEQQGGLQAKQVLEVGCGTGRFLHACQQRGAQVTGIDPSPYARTLACKNFGLNVLPLTLQQMMTDQRASRAVFNIICSFEVIEHVPQPDHFVRALASLLAPGGWLILSTPNFYLFHLMGAAAPVVRNWPEHLHFFEPDSLEPLITQNGLSIVEITTLAPLNYSQRVKQQIMQVSTAQTIWRLLRRSRALRALKDAVFLLVAHKSQAADRLCLNGTCLFAIARKAEF